MSGRVGFMKPTQPEIHPDQLYSQNRKGFSTLEIGLLEVTEATVKENF